MELKFVGLAVSQNVRPAKGDYPASTNIKFIEAVTGNEMLVNSSVSIDPSQLMKEIEWTLSGFFAGERRYFKDGQQRSFFTVSCQNISGVVRKSS